MLTKPKTEIVASEYQDKLLCDFAGAIGSGAIMVTLNFRKIEGTIELGRETTERVMRGLAYLSLLPDDYELPNGFTPAHADEQFRAVGGDDVICPEPSFFTQRLVD